METVPGQGAGPFLENAGQNILIDLRTQLIVYRISCFAGFLAEECAVDLLLFSF